MNFLKFDVRKIGNILLLDSIGRINLKPYLYQRLFNLRESQH